ncbi:MULTISPECIES: hypothetical protein [Winogradskyella]|nr:MULTISPECIES: hypothetical protein [Winogradskyella]
MKLPKPEKDETFIMRLSKKQKEKLLELAKKGKYGNNASEVLRNLLESAYRKS